MLGRNAAIFAGCLVVAVAARADLDVVIGRADTVRGTLLPASQTETYRFACPEGARISVSAASRGTRMRVGATLFAPQDVVAAGATGRRLHIRHVAAVSGEFRVDVASADGVSTGDYALNVRWRSPKAFGQTLPVAGNATNDLTFAADAGARVTFTLAASRGSAATPSLVRVADADGQLFPLTAGTRGTFDVPETGSYTLTFENTAAAAGDVVAHAKVRSPKAAKRLLLATSHEIPPTTNVVAAAVLDGSGGVVTAPVSGALSGARVTVPAGALGRAAIVVVGTAPEITPPSVTSSTRATPPAFIGPLGATFAATAQPTVELPLAPSGPVPLDAALRVYAIGGAAGPDVVPGAGSDGAIVTFAPPRLTRFQGYFVVQPEVPEPFVVDTMSSRALGQVAMGGGFAFIASPYSYDYTAGGAVGEGLVRVFERVGTTWIERGSLRSPAPVDSDFFGSSVAYRTSPTGPSDDSLLVSARDVDGPAVGTKGDAAVFEFTRDGSEWTFLRQLPPVTNYTFTVDGDRLLLVPGDGGTTPDLRRGPQGWTAAAPLTIPRPIGGFDLRGGTLLVGAPYPDPPAAHGPGSAYRYDVSGAGAVELAHYAAQAPAQYDFFGRSVSLGANFAAVQGQDDAPGVAIFRLSDDQSDGFVTAPVLPGVKLVLGAFKMHGDTLVTAAYSDLSRSATSFAGGFIHVRTDGAWTQQFALDAAPFLQLAVGAPLVGDIAYDGTTVVVPITLYHDSKTSRSAAAFFEIPQQ
jgi:hypothetical protein